MDKEFVPYQESLALKELGFDEPCFATYQKGLKGPIMWDYWFMFPYSGPGFDSLQVHTMLQQAGIAAHNDLCCSFEKGIVIAE